MIGTRSFLGRRRGALVAVGLLALAAGCAAHGREATTASARRRLADALAQASGTYRVRGEFRAGPMVESWEGFVAGRDEQYIVRYLGMTIDSRRLDGVHHARRIDEPDDWDVIPADAGLDPGVLLQADEVTATDDESTLVLHFAAVDVLKALARVPSHGPTTVRVRLRDGLISEVGIEVSGGATATIAYWDYGADLTVAPPPVVLIR